MLGPKLNFHNLSNLLVSKTADFQEIAELEKDFTQLSLSFSEGTMSLSIAN